MQVMKLKVDTFHNTDFKNNEIIQILNSFSHIPVLYIHVLIWFKNCYEVYSWHNNQLIGHINQQTVLGHTTLEYIGLS